jgi:hypothetical protein
MAAILPFPAAPGSAGRDHPGPQDVLGDVAVPPTGLRNSHKDAGRRAGPACGPVDVADDPALDPPDQRGRTTGDRVNLEKVVFGFFVVLAATLNFGFFIGDISDPSLHNPYELFAAVVVNLIATVLKFGDRTQIGAVHLATSLVADLQLIGASLVLGYAVYVSSAGLNADWTASVVSLSGGALLANVVSVVLLVIETVSFHRG